MKTIIKLTLVLAMTFSASSLFAQKFARVNSREILTLMPETKEMQTNLETFGKELQDQLEQIQVEFNNRYAEFEKLPATTAASVKQMKQQELQQLQARAQEFQQIAQRDYQNKEQELLLPITEKLMNTINGVAKAAGYAAVFDTMNFVYYDDAQIVNIDDAVKKALGIADAAPAAAPAK
jgi:outer membrane protein